MPTPWRIVEGVAHLSTPALTGLVDVRHPSRGLHCVCLNGGELPGMQALGVDLGASEDASTRLADVYVRQGDLVATYSPSPTSPLRVQAYWRILEDEERPYGLTGLGLEVSVQTPAWETAAELAATTELLASGMRSLAWAESITGSATAECAEIGETTSRTATGGCLFFDGATAGTAYAQMIHPADFYGHSIERSGGDTSGRFRVVHRLFGQRLEKGVILRARLRGVWWTQPAADADLAGCYEAFVTARLPLTT
jgi:hypothetical protein